MWQKEKIVRSELSTAEASESAYMRERVKAGFPLVSLRHILYTDNKKRYSLHLYVHTKGLIKPSYIILHDILRRQEKGLCEMCDQWLHRIVSVPCADQDLYYSRSNQWEYFFFILVESWDTNQTGEKCRLILLYTLIKCLKTHFSL